MPIAKDIPPDKRRPGTSRFASSIRYAATLNDSVSEIAVVSRRFAPWLDHETVIRDDDEDARRGERVEQVILSGIFSLETAAIELEAIAALRPRVSDPVRHIVLSYDTARGERPSPGEIERDVRTLLRQRGFTDARERSQRHNKTAIARFEAGRTGDVSPFVAIVHGDTDAKHVHIVVSTVAPNGAANPDFRAYGVNEHAAAMIAQAHGWEIVAGRWNGRLVSEQARSRGASEAEIEALLRRDAATLDRLREASRDGARTAAAVPGAAGRGSRRGGFLADHAEAVRAAYRVAESYEAFVIACHDIGVIAKYSEVVDRKTGHARPRLAFADALDEAGDSGSRVGVTARAVIAKYGPIASNMWGPIAPGAGHGSALSDDAVQDRAGLPLHRPAPSSRDSGGASAPGKVVTLSLSSNSVGERSASEARTGSLAPGERALADAVLRRMPTGSASVDAVDAILAGMGFGSRSMRAVRQRRQARRQEHLPTRPASARSTRDSAMPLEDARERVVAKRALILARAVQTSAGAELRDRMLADLDMRTSFAAWKAVETREQLVRIRAERAAAFADHQRETRQQLRRAWQVEKLFRDALRSTGLRGAVLEQAMSDAYQARRSAILASRKIAWAAVKKIRPVVKSYAAWLGEQSGVAADLARAQLAATARARADRPDAGLPPAAAATQRSIEPVHPTIPGSPAASQPLGKARRTDRFATILDRSDAEVFEDMARRRAQRDAEQAEDAHAERTAVVEGAVVKAAKKILGAAGEPMLNDMLRRAGGPERSAAVMAIREAVFAAGLLRRAGRSARSPEHPSIVRVVRGRPSRGR